MSDMLTVQIIDDVPANIGLLLDTLAGAYRLLVSESAESFLEQLAHAVPDLILLDVRMPGMDGFELCKHLQSRAEWRQIPVIFMTAVDEPDDKTRALELGAVDYVTKPVYIPEVLARVRTHLRIIALNRELEAQKEALEIEVNMRRETELHLQHSLDQAILSADPDGTIHFQTKRAEYLLFRYYGKEPQRKVPEAFMSQWSNALESGSSSWALDHSKEDGRLAVRLFTSPQYGEITLFQFEEEGAVNVAQLRTLGLSPRESEVLYWMSEGKSYPEIAIIIETSVRTVHKHAENLIRKLNVESKAAAIRIAMDILK